MISYCVLTPSSHNNFQVVTLLSYVLVELVSSPFFKLKVLVLLICVVENPSS